MTDQHPGYRKDWDITSESLCFASAIYSRLMAGEQDEATLQWLAKYLATQARITCAKSNLQQAEAELAELKTLNAPQS